MFSSAGRARCWRVWSSAAPTVWPAAPWRIWRVSKRRSPPSRDRDMSSLQGQVAFVTGATRGIGRAIAAALGAEGAVVVGTATSTAGAAEIQQALETSGIKGWGAVLDVTDAAAC